MMQACHPFISGTGWLRSPQASVLPGNGDVFLVAFNIISKNSIDNVREKWVPEITHHCPNTPWLLIGLQADHRASPDLRGICFSQQAGQDMAKELGKPAACVPCPVAILATKA